MMRKPLKKQQNGNVEMSLVNIKIALNNQQGSYQTKQLNDSLHLQYYGFCNINNLDQFLNINTLYLNNNVIEKIQNLSMLKSLIFLNLSNNRIQNIQNLQHLSSLKVLDLSFNKIKKISNLTTIPIQTLNINANLLSNIFSLEELSNIQTLSNLNLSQNQIQSDQNLYNIFKKLKSLKILYLKNTLFSRGISSYRKRTISQLQQLTFFDDRPVTEEEKMISKAWKQGGLSEQKQARKKIIISKQKLNEKLYSQIKQKIELAEKLREDLYKKITLNQQVELEMLYDLKNNKSFMNEKQYDLLCLQINELQIYLKSVKQQVKYMSVGQKPQISSLIQQQTQDCIYVYNIEEQDEQKVRNKFFNQQTKPIIFKKSQKVIQQRWVSNYDILLEEAIQKVGLSNQKELLCYFNMKIHEIDQITRRKTRRFSLDELKQKINYLKETKSSTYQCNQMNQLD